MSIHMPNAFPVERESLRLARIMQQNRKAKRFIHRCSRQGVQRMLPYVIGVMRRVLLKAVHGRRFREDCMQHVWIGAKYPSRRTAA